MLGDGYVDDASTAVLEDHKDKEQPQCDRRQHEGVGGHDSVRMIGEEVRHVRDGRCGCRRMYVATVDWLTEMPSFWSSP